MGGQKKSTMVYFILANYDNHDDIMIMYNDNHDIMMEYYDNHDIMMSIMIIMI